MAPMREPYDWGNLTMTTVKRSAVIPVSREALLDAGLIEPTLDERAEIERHAIEAQQRQAERAAKLDAAREHLAAITDPLARAVLDLHAENDRHECEGDDMDGYEAEYPEWPCRTVETVAAHYGIELP